MPLPLGNLHETGTTTHWMPKAAKDCLTQAADTSHAQCIEIPYSHCQQPGQKHDTVLCAVLGGCFAASLLSSTNNEISLIET